MAINHKIAAKGLSGLVEQFAEFSVIGPVISINAFGSLFEAQFAAIDFMSGTYQPRNCAEPSMNTARLGIGVIGQGVLKHHRVELEGFAVWINIGTRKQRAQQRHAKAWCGGEESVHKRIFGFSKSKDIKW